MAKDHDGEKLKSAYELAMARMKGEGEDAAPLSDEQKKALAEVDERARAGIAETEIMMNQRIAEARAAGDTAKTAQLELAKSETLREIREKGEADKERIRSG